MKASIKSEESLPLLCSTCGEKGIKVQHVTLESLLTSEAKKRIGEGPYRFCESRDCEVVYYPEQEGTAFTKADLTVRVGVKESAPPRLVCYCFDHTMEEIEEEVERTGQCTVLEDIKTQMKDGCWCETKSPRGGCCLGTVNKYMKAALAEYGIENPASRSAEGPIEDCCDGGGHKVAESEEAFEDCCGPGNEAGLPQEKVSGWNAERTSKLGAVFAAVAASACCWVPLLLLAFGVSGVAVSATFEKYRPIFVTLTFGFLGAAFYFTYRPRRAFASLAKGEDCCAADAATRDCCPPGAEKGLTVGKFNKLMLWVVTAAALGFVFFPNYVGAFLGRAPSFSSKTDLDKAILSIDGMTCEACAHSLGESIAKVPGVFGAEVSYAKGQAIVAYPKGKPAPHHAILSAIIRAGFHGSFAETSQKRLSIAGMTCDACAAHLQSNLSKLSGVASVTVDYDRAAARVTIDENGPGDTILKSAIEAAGYKVKSIETAKEK